MTTRPMRLLMPDGGELIEVTSIERSENNLLIKGKIMGAMPMSAVLRPEEARKLLRLVDFRLGFFLLTFLFRRSKSSRPKSPG